MTTAAAELGILTSNSSLTVLHALAPAFERVAGQRYAVQFDSAKTMLARIKGGETADIVVLGTAAIDDLAQKPDISSVDALRRALLSAKSIAHTVHGASGMYVPVLLERLGIAAEMKSRTVTRPGGYIGTVVAAGEAELAIQQIVELLAVPGVDLVGPLPDEVQQVFETAVAIFTASRQTGAAAALIGFLLSPACAGTFTEKGLDAIP
jgi:molybdate transport system substrate-binding protein